MNHDIPGTEYDNPQCLGDPNPIDQYVSWDYPLPESTLTIYLCHTRAADPIRIKYDFKRDGWIIQQGSKWEWGEDEEINCDWQEVAFIKAWARTPEEKEK